MWRTWVRTVVSADPPPLRELAAIDPEDPVPQHIRLGPRQAVAEAPGVDDVARRAVAAEALEEDPHVLGADGLRQDLHPDRERPVGHVVREVARDDDGGDALAARLEGVEDAEGVAVGELEVEEDRCPDAGGGPRRDRLGAGVGDRHVAVA